MHIFKYISILLSFVIIFACNTDSKSKKTGTFNNLDAELSHEVEDAIVKIIPKFPSAAEEKINLSTLDVAFIEELVLSKINIIRHNHGLSAFKFNRILQKAAKSQNSYQIEIGDLTHSQENPGMKTPMDRILSFGGKFQQVAENVQYQGFTIKNYGAREEVLTNTYEETAEKIVKSWVDSPGHFKNLMNPQYQFTGTSVAYSPNKKALFATQVYGG